jgi:aspartyl protease family protein
MRISSGANNFLREAVGWVLIGGVVFIGVYYFTDLRQVAHSYLEAPAETADGSDQPAEPSVSASSGEVHLHAADNGHFFSQAEINGRSVNVVVDTGATGVSLTYEDARDIGLRLAESDFTMESQTANGTAKIAPIMLDKVQIGDIEVRDVEAFVAEPGKLFQTLLGMSFLKRLSHIDIKGRELVLSQ